MFSGGSIEAVGVDVVMSEGGMMKVVAFGDKGVAMSGGGVMEVVAFGGRGVP